MPKKLFIKTDDPFKFIQIEFNDDGFVTSCISDDNVPQWIKSAEGRSSLHPHIASEANLLGQSYDVRLADPIQFWEV